MMRVRWFSVVPVLVLSGGLLAAEEPALDAKAAQHFNVQWLSVQYNKTVTVENPALSQNRPGASEAVTLSCQIEIRDPNLILGVSREGVITQIADSGGRQVAVPAPATQPHQLYEGLRYTQHVRPPQVSRWQAIMGYITRRAPPTAQVPQFVTELEPSRLTIRLDQALLGRQGKELRSVKGYFHALVAESIENIDVPFEPNDAWVRLTPDVEIQVKEAVCTPGSYRYWIDTRPQGGRGMRPLTIGTPLPGRMAVEQQFIGADGKSNLHPRPGFLPASVGGRGSGSGGNSQIKTIRFVVAVSPTERKIPFELSHVPLPNPDQQDRTGNE